MQSFADYNPRSGYSFFHVPGEDDSHYRILDMDSVAAGYIEPDPWCGVPKPAPAPPVEPEVEKPQVAEVEECERCHYEVIAQAFKAASAKPPPVKKIKINPPTPMSTRSLVRQALAKALQKRGQATVAV
jgi:hypothetical protein